MTDGWDAAAYDEHQGFVHEYGDDLLDPLDPAPGERVLDLGCGTGHLTARTVEAGADAVGVDRSAAMLSRARDEHPGLPLVRADAGGLPFVEQFDAALSNAVLHWIPDHEQDAALASIRAALRPGGRFVAELGGRGNVASIVAAVEAELDERGYDPDWSGDASGPWYFPRLGEYATRLEEAGFEVRYARLFDRPTELAGADGLRAWLDQFGDALLAPAGGERDAVVRGVEDRLRPNRFRPADEHDGDESAWVADYRRLRVGAVRA